MEALIKRPFTRPTFFLILLVAVAALLVIRVGLAGGHLDAPFWIAAADNVIGALVATALAAALIVRLLPDTSVAQLIEVMPADIGPLLAQASHTSDEWWFKGGAGRYLRAVTLPNLVRRARREHTTISLNVLLFNPCNDALCDRYAQYRRNSEPSAVYWTRDYVKRQIFATLFELYRSLSNVPEVTLRAGTIDAMSTFRFDLSSHYVLITKEGRQDSAIRCDRQTPFYSSYKYEIYEQLRWSNTLSASAIISHAYTAENARTLFRQLQLNDPLLENAADLEQIVQIAKEKKDPFS